MSEEAGPVAEVDALGLLCPLPVLRAEAAMQHLARGALLAVLADDPKAPGDLEAWCAGRGHHLLELEPLPREPGRPAWRCLVRNGS